MSFRWDWVSEPGRGRDFNKNNNAAKEKVTVNQGAEISDEGSDGRAPMFRLLRFYAIASAVAFATIAVLLVVVDRFHEFEKLIEAVERQNVGVARSFANIVWPRYSGYAVSLSEPHGDSPHAHGEAEELNAAVRELTGGLPVLRVKIYDRQGRTIYSSQMTQIGNMYSEHGAYLAAAGHGEPQSEYVHKHEFNALAGPMVHRDIVESYMPIWGADGGVEGVIEIYTDITQDLLLLDHRTVETALEVGTVFSFLYLLLFLIVRQGDRIVARQYACLMQSRTDLNRQNQALAGEMSAREELSRSLQKSERRYRKLSDRLMVAQEEERTRISRELHDGLGQGLAEIRARVERAADYLLTRGRDETREYLLSVGDTVKTNIEEVRRISMGLRPSLLDDLGIMATISWACRSFSETHPHLEIEQRLGRVERDLSEQAKTVVYRTLQEGLNNVVRHSRASRVRVRLERHAGAICFTISDNGTGIAAGRNGETWEERPRLGLCGLAERAQLTGGSFKLRSVPGVGTTIRLSWPVQAQERPRRGVSARAVLSSPQMPSATTHYEGPAFSSDWPGAWPPS